VFMSRPI